MKPGRCLTKAGFEVIIGTYDSIIGVDIEWLRGGHACPSCEYNEHINEEDGKYYLVWTCGVCSGGRLELVYEVLK